MFMEQLYSKVSALETAPGLLIRTKYECSDLNSDGPEITHLAQGLSLFSATPKASGLAVWHGGMVAW
jgi:hypothetical protein